MRLSYHFTVGGTLKPSDCEVLIDLIATRPFLTRTFSASHRISERPNPFSLYTVPFASIVLFSKEAVLLDM